MLPQWLIRKKTKPAVCCDVLVHIGAPKTGTSAIQKFCLENRKKLLQYGYYYPEHPIDKNGVSGGHSSISNPLLMGDCDAAFQSFQAMLSEARARNAILLLSSEGFYKLYDEFYKLCGEFSVNVIGFFRDPLDSIFSNYNQSVKRHYSTERLDTFCGRLVKSGNRNLSGSNMLAWADKFGDESCSFLIYENPHLKSRSAERVFVESLNIPVSEFSRLSGTIKTVNRSYTRSCLELKRLMNHVLDKDDQRLNSKIDSFLQQYSDESHEKQPYISELLDENTLLSLREKFSTPVGELKKRFGWSSFSIADYEKSSFVDQDLVSPQSVVCPGTPFKKMCEAEPDVVGQVKRLLRNELEKNQPCFSLKKLADLFSITVFEEDSAPPLMNRKRLEVLLSDTVSSPDYLREISLMMEATGDIIAARKIISRARELRPNGKGIKRIESRLIKKHKAKKQ